MGWVKLGQPVPESNLSSNTTCPMTLLMLLTLTLLILESLELSLLFNDTNVQGLFYIT